MEKEISEVAVELNSIFDNMSESILNKIPSEIRNYCKENASKTYKFEYEINKPLSEQDIKARTKGIIAVLYRDYISDESEKKEFNNIYRDFINEKEEQKRELYNSQDMFNKKETDKTNIKEKHLDVINEEKSFVKKIIKKILNIFK